MNVPPPTLCFSLLASQQYERANRTNEGRRAIIRIRNRISFCQQKEGVTGWHQAIYQTNVCCYAARRIERIVRVRVLLVRKRTDESSNCELMLSTRTRRLAVKCEGRQVVVRSEEGWICVALFSGLVVLL